MARGSTTCSQCVSAVRILRNPLVHKSGHPILRETKNGRNLARLTDGVSVLSTPSLNRPCGALSRPEAPTVVPEFDIEGLPGLLDSLKWDSDGLVAAIVQVTL